MYQCRTVSKMLGIPVAVPVTDVAEDGAVVKKDASRVMEGVTPGVRVYEMR